MENKENHVLTRLNALAVIAKQDSENAKVSNKTRKASYKALQDETLYVVAFGGIKANALTRKMFGKDGEFSGFKSMLADCASLVKVLQASEEKTFTYTLKNKEIVTVSLEKIKAFGESQEADKALDFSARNAWKNWNEINGSDETETVLTQEEKALAVAAEADGLDAQAIADMTPNEKAEYIAQGLLILEEENKAELEKQAAYNETEIRRLFALLPETAQVEFFKEIQHSMTSKIKATAQANAEEFAELKTA